MWETMVAKVAESASAVPCTWTGPCRSTRAAPVAVEGESSSWAPRRSSEALVSRLRRCSSLGEDESYWMHPPGVDGGRGVGRWSASSIKCLPVGAFGVPKDVVQEPFAFGVA